MAPKTRPCHAQAHLTRSTGYEAAWEEELLRVTAGATSSRQVSSRWSSPYVSLLFPVRMYFVYTCLLSLNLSIYGRDTGSLQILQCLNDTTITRPAGEQPGHR